MLLGNMRTSKEHFSTLLYAKFRGGGGGGLSELRAIEKYTTTSIPGSLHYASFDGKTGERALDKG